MINLLHETLQVFSDNGVSAEGVCWVGDGDNWCDWNNFIANADINYDQAFGSTEINTHLVIVGKDWWLERHEYDGSEWWEFKKLPEKPIKDSVIKVQISSTWF